MTAIPPTRASLLLRLRDPRDEAAWTKFVELYVPVIYGYARRQGLQDADAVDVTQDVLRAVAGSINRLAYDPVRGAFRSWLFTVVRRQLANWRRWKRNKPQGSGDPATHRILEEHPGAVTVATAWEAEWEQRLFARACAQARRTVTATTWQAFWRTAMENQAGKQVAADLGITVAAVYLARSRIVARLKQLVQLAQESVSHLEDEVCPRH